MKKVYIIRKVNYVVNKGHNDIQDYDQMIGRLEDLDDEARDIVFRSFFDAVEAVKEVMRSIEWKHICTRVEENTLSDDDWNTEFTPRDKTATMTIKYETYDFDLTVIFTIKETGIIVFDED